MGDFKLKVRLGQHEFEAEGPQEAVEAQFTAFRELVSKHGTTLDNQKHGGETAAKPQEQVERSANVQRGVGMIFHTEGKVFSLSARPQGENRELDAALLLLLGHRLVKSSELVSADDLINGLRQSGYSLERVAHLMRRGQAEGLVIIAGVRRGSRYRLTNEGLRRAEKVAEELMGTLA